MLREIVSVFVGFGNDTCYLDEPQGVRSKKAVFGAIDQKHKCLASLTLFVFQKLYHNQDFKSGRW